MVLVDTEPSIKTAIYLPEDRLTNAEIASWGLKTSQGKNFDAESVYSKTGVENRFVAKPEETVSDMGVVAARSLVRNTNPALIDFVFFSTSYPNGIDNASEATKSLGLSPDGYVNVHAACSGSTVALSYMHRHRERFTGKHVLLIASEKYSPAVVDLRIDPSGDPSFSQTIFGDGAAAEIIVLGENLEILSSTEYGFPRDVSGCLRMPIDKTKVRHPAIEIDIPTPTNGKFQMDGQAVYLTLRDSLPELVQKGIKLAGLEPSQIALIIPHQASRHMLDSLTKRLPHPLSERIYYDLQDGNLSSASIPKALDRAQKTGSVARGDKVVLAGFGAGLYASIVVAELG